MAKIWEFNLGYKILRLYTDWCTRTCYRRFRIEGKEKVPKDTPVILAPNHCCTLMDAVNVLACDTRPTAFGARADIFHSSLAPVLRWFKIVPLARQRDGLAEVAKNFEIFDEVADCVGHDIPFCIYVEGTHRPKRGLQPIRRGVFRIAKRAEEVVKKPVAIVPVGLAYESFFDLMTDVIIRYGDPVYLEEYDRADLPDVLGERILDLISDYPKRVRMSLWLSIPCSILAFPLWIASALLSSPILLVSLFLNLRLKDRAWHNSMRFLSKFLMLPLIVIPCSVLAFIHLPLWVALLSFVALLYAHPFFYLVLNLYKNVIGDIRDLNK